MSQALAFSLALFCVCLTALAQVLLKLGMSSPAMQQAMQGGVASVYGLALTSPLIWGGMICFGASAGLWLMVLGKLEVSVAYPLTALGILLTTLAGIFLLQESVSLAKLSGAAFIIIGVMLLAIKH